MKKSLILAASVLLCACGGQKGNQQSDAASETQASATKSEQNPDAASKNGTSINERLKSLGFNYFHYEDIDGDGKEEILAAEFDPAEGGCIFATGVLLNDKDLSLVTRTTADRQDVGISKGVVVKMTLDDSNKEHFEIFQIQNSKATPAPDGTSAPDYKSLTSYYIENWEEVPQ